MFAHRLALAGADHELQIFLTGEATYLIRDATKKAISRWLAAPERNARQSRGQADSGLLSSGVFRGPWARKPI